MTFEEDEESWAELPPDVDSETVISYPESEQYIDHVVIEGPLYAWALQNGKGSVFVHHYSEQVR